MKTRERLCATLVMAMALVAVAGLASAMEVERVSVETLAAELDTGTYVVVDVRRGSDWKGSEVKIPGALRLDPRDVEGGAAALPKDKVLVLYCA